MAKHSIRSPTAGTVWTHSTGVGQRVVAGTTLLILECMKMEIPVETLVDGTVEWLAACATQLEVDDLVAIVNDVPAP